MRVSTGSRFTGRAPAPFKAFSLMFVVHGTSPGIAGVGLVSTRTLSMPGTVGFHQWMMLGSQASLLAGYHVPPLPLASGSNERLLFKNILVLLGTSLWMEMILALLPGERINTLPSTRARSGTLFAPRVPR